MVRRAVTSGLVLGLVASLAACIDFVTAPAEPATPHPIFVTGLIHFMEEDSLRTRATLTLTEGLAEDGSRQGVDDLTLELLGRTFLPFASRDGQHQYPVEFAESTREADTLLSFRFPGLMDRAATLRIPTREGSGPVRLATGEDLVLHLDVPERDEGHEGFWRLTLGPTCYEGPSIVRLEGPGLPPDPLMVPASLLGDAAEDGFEACLQVATRVERDEPAYLLRVNVDIGITWTVEVVEPGADDVAEARRAPGENPPGMR